MIFLQLSVKLQQELLNKFELHISHWKLIAIQVGLILMLILIVLHPIAHIGENDVAEFDSSINDISEPDTRFFPSYFKHFNTTS